MSSGQQGAKTSLVSRGLKRVRSAGRFRVKAPEDDTFIYSYVFDIIFISRTVLCVLVLSFFNLLIIPITNKGCTQGTAVPFHIFSGNVYLNCFSTCFITKKPRIN